MSNVYYIIDALSCKAKPANVYLIRISNHNRPSTMIILSEQNGTVFAYLINYAEGYAPDAVGNLICSTPYYQFRYRLIFDGEQAFLLSLPNI